jgi:hypothetical protein
MKSPHAGVDTDKRRGFAGQACESCHGPAQKHAASYSMSNRSIRTAAWRTSS